MPTQLTPEELDDALIVHALMHPGGSCACYGEGRCAWCGQICEACGGDCCDRPCLSCDSTGWRMPGWDANGSPVE